MKSERGIIVVHANTQSCGSQMTDHIQLIKNCQFHERQYHAILSMASVTYVTFLVTFQSFQEISVLDIVSGERKQRYNVSTYKLCPTTF